jgi:hypothetical protein
MSKAGIAHVEKQLAKMKKDGNPGAKYLQKILDNPTSKTNVLRNGIAAHCFDCSWDSADPAESHPKNCTHKECAHYAERPMSGKEKADKKSTKEVAPEVKAKKQENAAKARESRKSRFKENLDIINGVV